MTISDLQDSYDSKLRRFALRLCRDSDEADDLVQEAFVRALGHLALLEQLQPHQHQAWFFTTLRNLWNDRYVARQRREGLHESFSRMQPSVEDPRASLSVPNPFRVVPEKYRDIVEMRYVMGMNSREIAERLDIPAATVRSRLHAAIKMLRKHEGLWE